MTPPVPAPAPERWERLDPKMLAIGPVTAARQMAFPIILGLFGLGSQDPLWILLALPVVVVGVVLLGFIPWFTTFYRVSDTQLEVRRGLLNRTRLTAPLDRVRSVDLQAPLLHRVLGLSKVEVGTGVDDTRIELDSLSTTAAEQLRHYLLERSRAARSVARAPHPHTGEEPPPDPGHDRSATLATLDWSWVRFAPFSLARLVVVAGALGVLGQVYGEVDVDSAAARDAWDWITGQALVLLVITLALACLVGWLVISVAGYVVQWFGYRLFRDQGNLRLTAGLFTTRSVTIEEARIRGARLEEPVLLRWVGGAEVASLATGVAKGVAKVLPPAPVPVAREVVAALLGSRDPVDVVLARHGPAARRRCHVRNQWATVPGTAVAVGAAVLLSWPTWVPVLAALVLVGLGAAVAEAEYHHLGHALTDDHLVSGTGALARHRTALEREGIIGWVLTQNIFQRRAGLATLTATTAAGSERVVVRDLDHRTAVAVADAATPGMLTEFLLPATQEA